MWFRRWRTVCSQDEVTIQKIAVGPGDTLVFRHPRRLSESAIANMLTGIRAAFPDNRAIVLEEGMSVDVMTAAEKGEADQ